MADSHPRLASVGTALLAAVHLRHRRRTGLAQHAELERDQRRWAVRLDTTPGSRSDWLFEREWRVPVSAEQPLLPLDLSNVLGIYWEPTTKQFRDAVRR